MAEGGAASLSLPGPLLITGAGGFVGRHVLAALARLSPGTRVLTPATDITDRDAVRALFAAERPAACLHLAAIAAIGVARGDPALAWSVNLHGTLAIAEAIRDLAPACRLIFVSSSDLYGASFRCGEALDEQALPAPLNTYAATKAAADLALGAMAAEGLSVLRLRPFNHTGPGQSDHFVVPAFARQIALAEAGRGPAVIRVGALAPERDFLDVRDVARAYLAAVAQAESLASGTVLNIASGVPRRIGDVLSSLLARAAVPIQVEEDVARLRPADIPRAVGDARQARDCLGWAPAIPWDVTLGDVLDDWRLRVRGDVLF
ncbi:NAD-dependent epimerase/dehydratase family protein [Acidomonas methanolica]|uniref:Oxidoreductase n=1 Tax=Acidomonas methanolica NBRC 104435 TaxID=1231351 RepID=A0A023D730_ACIMT|nr:GDP-mannose 4,6-dehydratase [Acidomonas methanolica]TCS29361.1 GDP-4-dehydro-6-deoxy-D-mannose reductase [Acidomonas methanolica]GAJ29611.1 oxidoreductase [Acidomonas methanolica NBRC 104435]GBQ49892.1 GDP-6-deoxy-D-lyxo-4-hexulose reductase [Acidomonas methanolica]GEK99436.1 GDP-6-deoxy-D-lyxo-4-hexulose reductase [Acidomonas methanolica NBRC 104435]